MRELLIVLALGTVSTDIAQHQSFGEKTKQPRTQRRQASTTLAEQVAETNARSQSGRPFTREEKAQLIARLFAQPLIAQMSKNQRVKVLTVALATTDKSATGLLAERRIAQVVIFNYSVGKATRLLVDSSNGEILREEAVRGRPQSSEEEIQEAIRIVRQDREVARLLQEKGVIEGGFVTDGPPGTKPEHRFLQLQVLSSDRLSLLRVIVVDLTDAKIVLSRARF